MTVNRSHKDHHQSKVHVITATNKHWYPWLTIVAKVTTGTFVTLMTKITIITRKLVVMSLYMATMIMSVTTDVTKLCRAACKMPVILSDFN